VPHLSDAMIASAMVRVSDLAESDENDRSDTLFSIMPKLVAGVEEGPVTGVSLLGSYPNPAAGRAELRWQQGARGDVVIRLFDARGSLVRRIELGSREAGQQGAGLSLKDLPPGIYHCELNAGGLVSQCGVVVSR
jgi:hypothetical protein